ncbi:hypothetical protein JYT16_00365 [Gemmatimonas aurantiaca]|nr:hypothetical protein [Gemmatimonas aurantiaca]
MALGDYSKKMGSFPHILVFDSLVPFSLVIIGHYKNSRIEKTVGVVLFLREISEA